MAVSVAATAPRRTIRASRQAVKIFIVGLRLESGRVVVVTVFVRGFVGA